MTQDELTAAAMKIVNDANPRANGATEAFRALNAWHMRMISKNARSSDTLMIDTNFRRLRTARNLAWQAANQANNAHCAQRSS